MEVGKLLTGERAVSPVIGIILMVAVTVILAAVVGTFVLGVGAETSSTTPAVSWEFSYDSGSDGGYSGGSADDSITIDHAGGDTIDETLTVQVDGVRVDDSSDLTYNGGGSSIALPVTAADSFTVEENATNSIRSGDRVFVIYRPDKPEFRALIGESKVPN